jgi:hypothetical protein
MTKLSRVSLTFTSQEKGTYYVIPPPELPQPAVKALAVPTTFLSKYPVVQTWHGTKLAPRMPTKKRSAIRPLELVTRPAIAVGIEPASRRPTKTRRGPKRSQSGPDINRMRSLESLAITPLKKMVCIYVASRATMFEFAISVWVK